MRNWTIEGLEREMASVRSDVAMAKREVGAGNMRMLPFLEAWFDKLLGLQFEKDRMKAEAEIEGVGK